METFLALVEALKTILGFATKAIPPDEIRIDRHKIRKPKLEHKVKEQIFNKAFLELRNTTSLEVDLWVDFVHDNLDEEDIVELKEMLKQRILQYRRRRPIRFKKWLEENDKQLKQ